MPVAKLIATLASIAAVTFLEYTAIKAGIDGVLLAAAVAIIAGLGGYTAKSVKSAITSVAKRK